MKMSLSCLTIEKSQQWDSIVRSFANHDVYYLSGYAKAFQLHGDGEPLLFYYEDETVRGINVVMKRDIAKDVHFIGKLPEGQYFDFSTPYGYGGWLIEGVGNTQRMYDTYFHWCADHGIVSEFIRFSLFSNSREAYFGEVIPRMKNVIRTLDRPMDDMLMEFEHKVRKNYNRAKNAGLELLIDSKGERLADFLKIYYGTMDRNSAEDGYYFKKDFFETINSMNGDYVYFHVAFEGKIISTELVLLGRETMYSYLGGTDSKYYANRPNDFLKCEVIRWGIEHGYKNFVLGGGYGTEDGIFRYKKSFAPNGIVQYYLGQKVVDAATYENLIAIRGNVNSSDFFPKYRG